MGKGRSRDQGPSQPGAVVSRDGSANIVGSPNVRITFQNAIKEKSVLETYILALALGFLGVHHFYLGRTGFGLAYMFTFGLLGVGYVVDLFRVPCLVADTNRKLREPSTGDEKSLLDAYILWFPFGILGFHHFYLRHYGRGILYVFTLGVLGMGWLVDGFLIPFMVEEFNGDFKLPTKNEFNGYLFALSPLGVLGGHHYYLNRPIWGILYTFTFGLMGVGWVFDWFRIPCLVRRANEQVNPTGRRKSLVKIGEKKYLDDAYILLFPFGFTGLHHFYLRRHVWGALYLFTFGLLGIGYLIDYFRLPCLVSEYNRARDNNRRIATNFLSSHPQGGAAVISMTSTSILPQGGITGSVMQPPPQVWNPETFSNYLPQQNPAGAVYPGLPGPAGPEEPPSYMEVMGGGSASYQAAMPRPQRAPGNGSMVPTDTTEEGRCR